MQIGQAWGTCLGVGSGWTGHWMLARGKTTEMGVVVPEGPWPHYGYQAGRQGLLGSTGSPCCFRCLVGGGMGGD